jgi:hypothetical protein
MRELKFENVALIGNDPWQQKVRSLAAMDFVAQRRCPNWYVLA